MEEIFRTFEHNGKVLQLSPFETGQPAKLAVGGTSAGAPGSGQFEIKMLSLSASKITAGETLTLEAQITGSHISYLYTEILLRDKEVDQYYGPVDQGFVHAERNKETRGVSRPDWEQMIKVTAPLRPAIRLLTDGAHFAFAFLRPEGYDSSDTQLEGLYSASGETTRRRAHLTFDAAGNIKKMLVFTGQGIRAMAHALTLKQGDQFSPFVQILKPPTAESPEWQVNKCISTWLTYGSEDLRMVNEPPLPGEYLAGLLVQDLDGKLTRQYTMFTLGE